MNLAPLTDTELTATRRKHAERLNALRSRGWQRRRPITRNDVLNYRIDQWQMRQGITPEED